MAAAQTCHSANASSPAAPTPSATPPNGVCARVPTAPCASAETPGTPITTWKASHAMSRWTTP